MAPLKFVNNTFNVQLKSEDPAAAVEFSGLHPGGFLQNGLNQPQTGETSNATVKFGDEILEFRLARHALIEPEDEVLVLGCPPDFHLITAGLL